MYLQHAHKARQDRDANAVRFTERAPEMRHEGAEVLAMAGYALNAAMVLCMLLTLSPFAPESFGTAVGDSVFSEGEQWLTAILLCTILVCGVFFRSLQAPYPGTVKVEFSAECGEVRILHGGLCTEDLKLADIHAAESGPCPLTENYRNGLMATGPRWFFPAWFFPNTGTDALMRRRAVTEFVYFVTGQGAARRRVEIAAFMAHGGHGVDGAEDAARALNAALREARKPGKTDGAA